LYARHARVCFSTLLLLLLLLLLPPPPRYRATKTRLRPMRSRERTKHENRAVAKARLMCIPAMRGAGGLSIHTGKQKKDKKTPSSSSFPDRRVLFSKCSASAAQVVVYRTDLSLLRLEN
jgi:hypothetical protein